MRFSNEEIYSSEKIKYICQTERKNSPRIEFLERKQERNREREMKIQSACGPCFFALSDGKKNYV